MGSDGVEPGWPARESRSLSFCVCSEIDSATSAEDVEFFPRDRLQALKTNWRRRERKTGPKHIKII